MKSRLKSSLSAPLVGEIPPVGIDLRVNQLAAGRGVRCFNRILDFIWDVYEVLKSSSR